jgi:tetratricopeptide (TPR) repeat protein
MRSDIEVGAENSWSKAMLRGTVVGLTAIGVYARTVTFGWAFDDQMGIVRNTTVHSLGNLPQIFSTTVWADSGMQTYLYRPLTALTYALNHAVSGLQPWSYHLANMLLFAGTAVLVFRLGRLWRLSVVAASLGALIFAVHPIHVEVVANVSGRKDLLAAVFVLGMALSHRYALGRRSGWVIIPTALYACAMLSKEVGVMGLFLVAAQDLFLERDGRAFFRRPRVVGMYLAYGGALIAYVVVRVAVTGALGVPETFVFDNPLVGAGAASRVGTAAVVVGKGVVLLFAPIGQSADYSYDAIRLVRSAADARLWATLAGAGVLVWGFTYVGVRRSVFPLALAWYALALLPASNLLVTAGTIFGERLLYLPSVAFCLVAGAGIAWVAARRPQVVLAGTAVVVAALTIQTVRYSGAWSDDITLFEWATESVPRSTKAHHKLGEEYLRVGRLGDALRSLDRAVAIAPDNRFAAATRGQAQRAVVERYGSFAGIESEVGDPDVLYVLGQSSMQRGDSSRAIRLWEMALVADATHAASLADLGASRLQARDIAGAVDYLERAVASDPHLASAWFNLARIRLDQGDTTAAVESLRHFVRSAGFRYPSQVAWARRLLRQMGVNEGGGR